VVGPTGVGKTGLIVSLAGQFGIEVISLDSRQIYHGLRIGTAQPTAAEKAACPHHLVDFVPPDQTYSAARFRHDFAAAFQEIRRRGNQPVLVGGAGLYLAVLREGLFELPPGGARATDRVRAELDELSDREIRDRLQTADPESWHEIHPNDRYRSQRALEILAVFGRTRTELRRERVLQPCLDLDYRTVYLTRSVPELDQRLAARTEAMLAAGWLAETEGLLARYGPEAPGLQSIGYREIVAHLQGTLPVAELGRRIVTVTRQYAKRQRTWFRAEPAAATGAPEDPEVQAAIAAIVAEAAGAA